MGAMNEQLARSDPDRTGPTSSRRSLRLLLVDDSVVILERLARVLSGLACVEVVGSAADVASAVREIEALEPELIVLDASLGRADGAEVLRHVTRNRPGIDVLVFSNDDARSSRERFLKAGASGYFDKSLEFDALREAIIARARAGSTGSG